MPSERLANVAAPLALVCYQHLCRFRFTRRHVGLFAKVSRHLPVDIRRIHMRWLRGRIRSAFICPYVGRRTLP